MISNFGQQSLCLTKAEFFKGLSKGLIPSDGIGVDFYIKETEPHKKRRSNLSIFEYFSIPAYNSSKYRSRMGGRPLPYLQVVRIRTIDSPFLILSDLVESPILCLKRSY